MSLWEPTAEVSVQSWRGWSYVLRTSSRRVDHPHESSSDGWAWSVLNDLGVEIAQGGRCKTLAPLALWRLQRLWPDLTEPQRAGVLALVAGGGYGSLADGAEARGVCRLAAKHGQIAVLARLEAGGA